MKKTSSGKVYFIGAGPGDPELITLKGQKILSEADVILYAGSLVSEDILWHASEAADCHNSAGLNLERQISLIVEAARQGKIVARLHTGDPSIFGAIDEQIRRLEAEGITCEVIPGVSSVFAVAAALGVEFTLPELTQTLILTRMDGRTPVPEREKLRDLAAHSCSLAIFLSTGMITSVVDELRAAGFSSDTPIAVVYRASWPDQLVVRGDLADIAGKLERYELTHQGMIIVSPALKPGRAAASHLYGGFQQQGQTRSGTAILTLTAPAAELGYQIYRNLPEVDLWIPERFQKINENDAPRIHGFHESIRQVLQSAFQRYSGLVCIMASGIVMRELAPLLTNKHTDPAVVVTDPLGKYAVSLLSGHEGGANRLAKQIAAITGGEAVITTASDNRQMPALDVLSKDMGWTLDSRSRLAEVMAAMVNGDPVGFFCDPDINLPEDILEFPWAAVIHEWGVDVKPGFRYMFSLTYHALSHKEWETTPEMVVSYPAVLMVGIGCNRGTSAAEIKDAVFQVLTENGLTKESVSCVATITDKADEPGLIEFCRSNEWELRVFSHDEINSVGDLPNPSGTVQKILGVPGVAEPAALLASGAARLLVHKQKFTNVTVAIALKAGDR